MPFRARHATFAYELVQAKSETFQMIGEQRGGKSQKCCEKDTWGGRISFVGGLPVRFVRKHNGGAIISSRDASNGRALVHWRSQDEDAVAKVTTVAATG